jgi:HSP20 family protein
LIGIRFRATQQQVSYSTACKVLDHRRDDVTISRQEDVLTLEDARQLKLQQEDVKWHRRERAYGTFSRTVQLPFRVDPDKVQARFDNGILQIELERREVDRPKKIEIRAA